ncbi:MAG: amino acid adenylation domain-containing protein, partial [Myxococcales bacterium]|nr:amino acid adenylation domain-containing protein [Myxococcales bacterium]
DVITPAERALLVEWNDTARPIRDDVCIHALFAEQVARTPNAIAVAFEDDEVTYSALFERANALARHLRDLGVGPEVRVGLCLERSVDAIVAMLGVLMAGGAYLPLEPGWPSARKALMLHDAEARVVIVRHLGEADSSGWGAATPLALAALPVHRDRRPAGGLRVPATALAYVIYTSGSAGRPKGVAATHGSVIGLIRPPTYVDPRPGDRILHAATLAFDAATFEVWHALLTGATVVVLPPGPLSTTALARTLVEADVTCAFFTTRLFNLLVEEHLDALRHVATVLTGGERVSPSHMARALATIDGALLHVYGPTETTTFSCARTVTPDDPQGMTVPIGRALPDERVWLLDDGLRLCPVGAPGALHVAGIGLARGYLGRPGLTAERFVPDPFGPPGSRMYRTGDRARWRADGNLEFLGRLDFQVKIRGFRIELGEIEAALGRHSAVRQCVVMARTDDGGEARLVAYIAGDATPVAALRANLAESLPGYMIPSAFMWLDAMPLTPNGKVDRKALPAPELDREALSAGFVAPRTPTEAALAAIWSEVLGLDVVGANDDFFELGGHSLRATQVASRIAAKLGAEVPLRALFEATTVAAQARLVEAAAGVELPPIEPVDRRERLPLSFAQERLWFLDRLTPNTAEYNIPLAVWLRGPLNVDALSHALNWLLSRHEALRTTLPSDETGPWQRIAAVEAITLLPEPVEGIEALRVLVQAEALRPFDLVDGPVTRSHLWRLDDDTHVLLLNVHHVAFDGWSVGVVLRELSHAYVAFAAGAAPSLPERALDYADFAAWQRRWLSGEALESRLAYWKQALADAPVLDLPTDHPRPAMRSNRGASVPFALDAALTDGIEALCLAHGITPFMALLTAFSVVLSRHSGQDDIVIGSPIANRNRAELEGLVGFFVNTLALRVDLSGEPTVAGLLARVRKTTLDAYAHQDALFYMMIRALGRSTVIRCTPLFQVMLVL